MRLQTALWHECHRECRRLADRICTEYGIPLAVEGTSLYTARWVEADTVKDLEEFTNANESSMAEDHAGAPVFLARNSWHLDTAKKDWPKVRFLEVKEQAWNS